MANNQFIVAVVVVAGIGAIIWSTSAANPEVELDPEEFGLGDDTAREKELAALKQEFEVLQRELIPADITAHRLSEGDAARFEDLANRAEQFADSAEHDMGSQARAKQAVNIMDRSRAYTGHVPVPDAERQVVPGDKPVPTRFEPGVALSAEVFDDAPAGFNTSPPKPALVMEVEPEPHFNVGTSNVDHINPGHDTVRTTSDRGGKAHSVFDAAPKEAALTLGVPPETEAHDDDQNSAGLNVPQSSGAPENFAPVEEPDILDLTESPYDTIDSKAEHSELSEWNYGPTKKPPRSKRVASRSRSAHEPSFVADPGAASAKDPTQNPFKAVRTEDDIAQDEFFLSLMASVTTTLEQPIAGKQPPVSKVTRMRANFAAISSRMRATKSKLEADRLIRVLARLAPAVGPQNSVQFEELRGEIDDEYRSKFKTSPVRTLTMGDRPEPRKRRRSTRLKSLQDQGAGATKDV